MCPLLPHKRARVATLMGAASSLSLGTCTLAYVAPGSPGAKICKSAVRTFIIKELKLARSVLALANAAQPVSKFKIIAPNSSNKSYNS